jgi:hypothetical protein
MYTCFYMYTHIYMNIDKHEELKNLGIVIKTREINGKFICIITCICMYIYECLNTYLNMHINMYIHIYVIYMYVYTYIGQVVTKSKRHSSFDRIKVALLKYKVFIYTYIYI